MKKFEPGEWAVLRHSNGGRTFQVGGISTREGDDGNYRVWEAQSELAQQTKQPKFEVWASHLVKVADREAAAVLVGQLDYIDEEHKRKVRELEQERTKAFNRAVAHFEVWEPEPE
jgi:hypothetical protein